MSLRAVAGFFFGQLGAITGLAYYYGWVHSGSFLNYFGIDSSLVELSTTDYLIRAVEPAFIPLVILSVVAALAGTAHPRIVASLRTRGTHVQRRYALALATAGIVLAAVASYRTFIGSSSTPISDALTFAAGLLMINYGLLLPKPSGQFDQFRPGAVPQLALAVLVVVALFLAAGSYAYQNGSRSADVFAQTLAFRSNVRVFSSHPLGIATTGVAEFDSGDEGGLRYRYDGLSLLVRSGDRYLLIPKEWRSRSDPVVS